jgi:hypothetical protein
MERLEVIETMKIMRRIYSIVSCLLTFGGLVIGTGFTSLAIEADVEASYNSVVEVEGYAIEEGYIEAGKEANVVLTLRNTNRDANAVNIVVTVSSNSGMVYPKYGDDNQFYVGDLEAGKNTTVTIPIVVASSFVSDYVDFNCTMNYVMDGMKITNSSTMVLPGLSNVAISVNSLEVSAHAVKNSQSLLSINYSNKGAYNINDAVVVVDGNVSEATKEIDLGTVAAGKAYNKDCNVIYTESGEQTITVMLKYTDVNGEQVQSDLGTFRVTVAEENTSTIIEKENNPYLVWIGRGIAAVALLIAIVVFVMYVRKH